MFFMVQIVALCLCTVVIGVFLTRTLRQHFFLFYHVIRTKIIAMLGVQILSEVLFTIYMTTISIPSLYDMIYEYMDEHPVANSLLLLLLSLISELFPLTGAMYSL